MWAAGFKTCGTFVVPSIMTDEALYYPLEVWGYSGPDGSLLFSPDQQHICVVLGLTFLPPSSTRGRPKIVPYLPVLFRRAGGGQFQA